MMSARASWQAVRTAAPPSWSFRRSPARRRWACAASAAGRRPVAAAWASVEGGSVVQGLVASGKLNKTALGKLPVAVLREECSLTGLPTDGTKPVLVERLLLWASTVQPDGGPAQEPPTASAAPAPEPPASSPPAVQLAAAGVRSTAAAQPPAAAVPAPVPDAPAAAAAAAAAVPAPPAEVTLTFLGTSSGSPTSRRNVSSIAVRLGEELCVVDVGEGSRNQLRRAGLDPGRVRRVFITHLHGDHCFGVCGLLAEICQARQGTPLQQDPIVVFGPPELHSLIAGTMRLAALQLTTPVVVLGWVIDPARAHTPRPVDASGMLQLGMMAPDQAAALPPEQAAKWQAEYDGGSDQVVHPGLTWSTQLPGSGARVVAAQLQHRIPCWGYVFQEPAQLVPPPPAAATPFRRSGGEASPAAGSQCEGPGEGEGPAVQQVQQAQQQWVRRGRKMVVLGDTCDSRAIAVAARNCDIISHEATFMRGMERKAQIATHSTSEQAGAFARQINAKNLVLTHFSARYDTGRKEGKSVSRGRGNRGSHGGKVSMAEQGEEDLDEGELQRLIREAQRTFGSGKVFLASDYFTFKVYPHDPQPLAPAGASASREEASATDDGEEHARPLLSWEGYGRQRPQQQPQPRQQETWRGRAGLRSRDPSYAARGATQRWQEGLPGSQAGQLPRDSQQQQQQQWGGNPGRGAGNGSRPSYQQESGYQRFAGASSSSGGDGGGGTSRPPYEGYLPPPPATVPSLQQGRVPQPGRGPLAGVEENGK